MIVERLVDSGLIPEAILRAGIRGVCALRLRDEGRRKTSFIDELRRGDLAIATAQANEQHYEVPTAFYELVLGPHLKYSSCYWPPGVTTLAAAEVAMLELYAQRAGLVDGQDVLDLGCGWGSFSLWAAKRFPNSRFVAVSNSRTQRDVIEVRKPDNVTVRTADIRSLELDVHSFDRIVTIEMFEHMRNYTSLLAKVARWLRPDGKLFVHVFAHRRFSYPFDDRGASDWMAREFFTGGIMPSADLFEHFQDDLQVAERWQLDGSHYARTAEAWYENLLRHKGEVVAILGDKRKYERWRVFFLACAELFGYRSGSEWVVAHTLMTPRR